MVQIDNIPGTHFRFLNIGCHTCDEAGHFSSGLDLMEIRNIGMLGSKHLQHPLRFYTPCCPLCMDISCRETHHNLKILLGSEIGSSPPLFRKGNREARNKAESNYIPSFGFLHLPEYSILHN